MEKVMYLCVKSTDGVIRELFREVVDDHGRRCQMLNYLDGEWIPSKEADDAFDHVGEYAFGTRTPSAEEVEKEIAYAKSGIVLEAIKKLRAERGL